jgi:hypothetical protein
MNRDMLKQGPMTKHEAEQLARRYREQGKMVIVTEAFDKDESSTSTHIVFVDLPVMANAPKPSRDFQNKMWS